MAQLTNGQHASMLVLISVIFVLVYFFVLVSFQFYSIGDFYKYVMMHITSHQHILDILHQHIGDCHT